MCVVARHALHEQGDRTVLATPSLVTLAVSVVIALPVVAGFALCEAVSSRPRQPIWIRVASAATVALTCPVGLDGVSRNRFDAFKKRVLGHALQLLRVLDRYVAEALARAVARGAIPHGLLRFKGKGFRV